MRYPNQIKIVFFVADLRSGGIQKSVIKLLSACQGEKYLILLHDRIKLELPPNVLIYSLINKESKGRLSLWCKLVVAIIRLRKTILNLRPTVLASFGYSTNVIAILALMFLKDRPKIAVSIRNSILEISSTRSKFSPVRLLTSWVYRFADVIIPVSHGIASELRSSGVASEKIKVIKNGYNISKIEFLSKVSIGQDWKKQDGIPVIISAGRLTRQKNFGLLLKAFQLVKAHVNCKLVILGNGPEEESLKKLAQYLQLNEGVSFIRYQENPYNYFSNSDVFVLPSLWEGFPNVICEAMICGTPVVATDCQTGPNEIIKEGHNGLLVPIDDKDALAKAILMLLKDKDLRDFLTIKAKDFVRHYSVNNMAKSYDAVFSSLSPQNNIQ